MPNPARRVLSHGTAAALLAASLAVEGQSPQRKPDDGGPQRPQFRTEANFVRVDVYPTLAGKPLGDLRREDFELFEDGRPQTIETFEFIRVPAAPHAPLADPGSLEAMRQAAANPRSRVFVIFLDAPHVTADGARHVGEALIRFIDRALGADDLVGVMTPWMSPADIVLARKTEVIARGLREASWARRFTPHEDEHESRYKSCYHVLQQELEQGKAVSDLARILTLRRREVMTLEALRDLVMYLRDVREERKAVLTVSEGWALFRPDPRITRLREECTCPLGGPRHDLQDCSGCEPWPRNAPWKEPVPSAEPIRVGPDGKLTTGSIDTPGGPANRDDCNRDRMWLASIDNGEFARDLASDANRANATFYTIDPRGLAVFDMPIYRDADEVGVRLSVAEDRQSMTRRHDALANLASATDGIALLNSSDLDAGLRRIADDLSVYYLLGYYSTNPKLDGRYRTITVRVKQRGVEVRARRGYRAPTEAEVSAARRAAAPSAPEPRSALASALAGLSRVRSAARFRMHATRARSSASDPATTVWVAGELPTAIAGWTNGGTVAIDITGAGVLESAQLALKPGERGFVLPIRVPTASSPIDVRGRLTNADPAVTPFTESLRLDLHPDAAPQPLLFRRGPSTANRLQPAADFQFSRSDRVRLEVPVRSDVKPGQGRVLDKNGQALKVPVDVGERADAGTGQRWLTADVILAALGSGDYVVEVGIVTGGAEEKILTAIRVTR